MVGIDPVAFANHLEDNYPNPFNPTTTIKYSIASSGHVSLKIYNAAGQLVRTLVNEEQAPRAEGFAVTWDGTSNQGQPVASGVYFYKLATEGFSQTKKMALLK
jgi:flagellar hook assembly protein FlgD